MPVSGRCADGVATVQLDPMKLNARGMLHAAGGRAPRQSIPEAGTAGVIGHGPVVVSRKCDADDEAAPACFSFERETRVPDCSPGACRPRAFAQIGAPE